MLDKKLAKYIYLFSMLFALVALIFFPKWIVDDAYITFRYSANLANHFQLTYNIDTNPVEGYTGIILPILIAFAMKVGISPVVAVHSIGVISYIIGGIFLFLVVKRIRVSEFICAIIILLYSTTPIIFTHVYSGLETILFSTTITIIVYFSITILQYKSFKISYYFSFSLLLLFFSLIRPEGILFSLLISGFSLFYFFTEKRSCFKKLSISLITIFVIPFIIYFLWRWNFYGQFFPNTYYLKTGDFTFSYKSYKSFMEFVTNCFGVPFIIAAFFILINIDNVWNEFKNKENEMLFREFLYILLPAILFTITLLIQYFHTDLLMNFSYRFFYPTFTIFLIILALFLNIGFKNLKVLAFSNPLTYKGYFVLLAVPLFLHYNLIISEFKKETTMATKMKALTEEVHISTGQYLKEHFNKKSTLLVHADAGAIPYFSKLKTIDFGGLNDDFLAHRNRLSNEQIIEYFFGVNADILAITSFYKNKLKRKKGSLNWDTLKDIIKDERFKKYTLVKIFEASVWSYYEYVFVKNKLLDKIVTYGGN